MSVGQEPVPVEVTVQDARDGVAVVAVVGDVDVAAVDVVRDAVVRTTGTPAVVLDLARVDLLASAGLTLLLETDETLRRAGRTLLLAGGGRSVRRSLQVTGLDRVLVLHDDVDEAVAAAAGRVGADAAGGNGHSDPDHG